MKGAKRSRAMWHSLLMKEQLNKALIRKISPQRNLFVCFYIKEVKRLYATLFFVSVFCVLFVFCVFMLLSHVALLLFAVFSWNASILHCLHSLRLALCCYRHLMLLIDMK